MTGFERTAAVFGNAAAARRDVERFRQVLGLQRRLLDPRLSPRARRALMHRGPFERRLARNPRRDAGGSRALAWIYRSVGLLRSRTRGQLKTFLQPAASPAAAAQIVSTGYQLRLALAEHRPTEAVSALEFAHEIDEPSDTFLRKRVVDRRSQATDRAMPFQAVETGRLACRSVFSKSSLGNRNVMFMSERLSFCAVPR